MTVERIQNFGEKLSIALKALNLSRGKLASKAGVDKSLVGRWASGQVMPSGHNLARIGEIVQATVPGFSGLSWELPVADFARLLGAGERPAAEPTTATGYVFKSRPVSLEETSYIGKAYVGVFAGFRQAYGNTGAVIVEGHEFFFDGPELKFRCHDGFFTHSGHVMVIKGQVYLFGESDTRQDGLMFSIFHGVNGSRAMVLDGVQLSVAADRFFTPAAMKTVLLRVADASGDTAVDHACFEAMWPKLTEINTVRNGRAYLPPKFAPAIDNSTGSPRPDGGLDHSLRIPADRSFSISDTELGTFDLPDMALARFLLAGNVVPLRRPHSAA